MFERKKQLLVRMHAYNFCVSLMTEVTLTGNSEEIKFMYSDTGTSEFFFFDLD